MILAISSRCLHLQGLQVQTLQSCLLACLPSKLHCKNLPPTYCEITKGKTIYHYRIPNMIARKFSSLGNLQYKKRMEKRMSDRMLDFIHHITAFLLTKIWSLYRSLYGESQHLLQLCTLLLLTLSKTHYDWRKIEPVTMKANFIQFWCVESEFIVRN